MGRRDFTKKQSGENDFAGRFFIVSTIAVMTTALEFRLERIEQVIYLSHTQFSQTYHGKNTPTHPTETPSHHQIPKPSTPFRKFMHVKAQEIPGNYIAQAAAADVRTPTTSPSLVQQAQPDLKLPIHQSGF